MMKTTKANEPNFIQTKIDTYKSWSSFEKLQFYFKLLAVFLAVKIIIKLIL
jgi:hypothetical protein